MPFFAGTFHEVCELRLKDVAGSDWSIVLSDQTSLSPDTIHSVP